MDEAEISRVLRQWAKADEEFFEELLQRCLAVLDQGDRNKLDDADLELLAAAGDALIQEDPPDDV